jgi:5'-nucleotidase
VDPHNPGELFAYQHYGVTPDILTSAKETLFTFDSFGGLQRMFLDYSITFTAEDFQDYQAVNKPLWVDYQNGAISALQLQHQRFDVWAERLSVTPGSLNDAFLNAMAEICAPLPGAVSLLDSLKGKAKLGIITNGFTALQQIRLERTGLRDYFDALVISEEVGVPKPDSRIFDYALTLAGNPERSRVLMVGDTAESDIRGGNNAGLATCWLNAHDRALPEGINPTWTVASLDQLEQLLCKH